MRNLLTVLSVLFVASTALAGNFSQFKEASDPRARILFAGLNQPTPTVGGNWTPLQTGAFSNYQVPSGKRFRPIAVNVVGIAKYAAEASITIYVGHADSTFGSVFASPATWVEDQVGPFGFTRFAALTTASMIDLMNAAPSNGKFIPNGGAQEIAATKWVGLEIVGMGANSTLGTVNIYVLGLEL